MKIQMTDKINWIEDKIKDNDIVKSLKCCIDDGDRCDICPLNKKCQSNPFVPFNIMYALDLINRKDTQIKELEVELKAMRGAANSYKLENERLLQKLQQAKSEAIKEFWERLKEEIRCEDDCGYHCHECHFECKNYVISGDNLVKEMTEVSE